MFSDSKLYIVVGILLILALGYFVYISYRDVIVLKNEMKELKENLDFVSEDDLEEGEEYEFEDEETEEIEQEAQFPDVNSYFKQSLETIPEEIEEVEASVPVEDSIEVQINDEILDEVETKPKKGRKKKN